MTYDELLAAVMILGFEQRKEPDLGAHNDIINHLYPITLYDHRGLGISLSKYSGTGFICLAIAEIAESDDSFPLDFDEMFKLLLKYRELKP